MWTHSVIYNLMCLSIVAFGHNFRNFDDSVRFEINWPGKANADLLETQTNVEPYYITTANKERYQCLIVNNVNNAQNSNEPYDGPNPIEILSGLFIENSCSHRLDPYWSYELCHGRYVRQYHENRDGKKVKTQEYYLGTFDKLQILKLFTEYAERKANPAKKKDIPVKKINGVNMPYVEIEMGNGTICDLTNKPRKIKVLYICYPHGTHELSSVEEPVSCEYEVIVASSWLCNHPDYKQAMGENEINCHPVDNAPKKPRALVAMEMESLQLRYLRDDKQQKVYAIFRVDNEDQAGDSRVRVEILPAGAIEKQSNNNIEDSMNSITDHAISPAEISPVKSFLSGKNCLHGGNGWWKYEFCYGRSVVQYHVERDGKKTLVNLGNFDKQKHLDWIAAHPHKKTKSPELRKQLSHFYSDGTVCDKTGNPRQTEVKLKCIENHSTSPFSVSLFLLEPKTCEYVLGVESPLICDILEYADENGLLSEKFEVNFDKLKTTAFHEYDDLDERIANGDD